MRVILDYAQTRGVKLYAQNGVNFNTSVLCPQAGKYDNNTIEIQGTVEIILE